MSVQELPEWDALAQLGKISIHLMCRFKQEKVLDIVKFSGFQYILCVGSSVEWCIRLCWSVLFQYILCVGSSIPTDADGYAVTPFQYILCVGSRSGDINLKYVGS